MKPATAGVSIIGGCCGTTPDYIAEAVRQTDGLPMPKRSKDFSPRLCVPTAAVPFSEKTVIANLEDPNKNGTLKECYHCNDASELINLALDAADEGAEVFCINTAVPGIDEISMMETAVKEVQTLCRLPLLLSASSRKRWRPVCAASTAAPLYQSQTGKTFVQLPKNMVLSFNTDNISVGLIPAEIFLLSNLPNSILTAKRKSTIFLL